MSSSWMKSAPLSHWSPCHSPSALQYTGTIRWTIATNLRIPDARQPGPPWNLTSTRGKKFPSPHSPRSRSRCPGVSGVWHGPRRPKPSSCSSVSRATAIKCRKLSRTGVSISTDWPACRAVPVTVVRKTDPLLGTKWWFFHSKISWDQFSASSLYHFQSVFSF